MVEHARWPQTWFPDEVDEQDPKPKYSLFLFEDQLFFTNHSEEPIVFLTAQTHGRQCPEDSENMDDQQESFPYYYENVQPGERVLVDKKNINLDRYTLLQTTIILETQTGERLELRSNPREGGSMGEVLLEIADDNDK